jgi:nucleoid-associated protein YgaU
MSNPNDFSDFQGDDAPDGTKIYEVQCGDSLSGIAKREYGDAYEWERIFEANFGVICDPNRIFPGQKIRIPPPP